MNAEIKVSRKKSTIWNVVFAYTNIAYAIVSGLVLVPFYLRFVPFELYGAWMATGNILHWVLVVDPGLSTVILQRVGSSYGAGDERAIGRYAASGLFITSGISLLVVLLGIVIAPQLGSWVNLNDSHLAGVLVNNFLIGVAAGGITLFAFAVGVVNMGMQRSFAHGMIFLIANLLTLGVTVFLLFSGFGLYAISLGLLTRAVVFAAGGMAYMFFRLRCENVRLELKLLNIREMLSLLSFTSLGKIGGLLTNNMDAFLIARLIGPEKVPVYVLSRRGVEVAITLLSRTGNAIGPGLSHLNGESDPAKLRSILKRLLRMNLWVLGLTFGGFLALNEGFVRVWVGENFFVGSAVSQAFCLFMVFSLIFTLLQTICVALGDIKRSAVVQFIQSLLVFACLLAGTSSMGLLGAALAPIVGFLAVAIWYYPRSLVLHSSLDFSDMSQLGFEALITLGIGLALSLAFSDVSIDSWLGLIIWSGMFSILYGAVLYAIRPMLRQELAGLRAALCTKLMGRKRLA